MAIDVISTNKKMKVVGWVRSTIVFSNITATVIDNLFFESAIRENRNAEERRYEST
jgi:hypothetical protein